MTTKCLKINRRFSVLIKKIFLIIILVTIVMYFKQNEKCEQVILQREINKKNSNKVILAWTPFFISRYYYFGRGNDGFDKLCKYKNCYLTDDRRYLPEHEFDAIVFHGSYKSFFSNSKPTYRSIDQYYVFVSLESSVLLPEGYKGFYNITMTFRLDSDIPWTYFKVIDKNGLTVAPNFNPKWIPYDDDFIPYRELKEILKGKSKKIAWFVSNCKSANGREKYVERLKKYVKVDVYGLCGDLKCDDRELCYKMINDDYFFYLAFENSNSEDYITEKVLTGLKNNAIPIFYGSVNLTRFLPPKSYIDASVMAPEHLAGLINYLLDNRDEYYKYFWWQKHYVFISSGYHPFCELCEFLNNNGYVGRPRSRILDGF